VDIRAYKKAVDRTGTAQLTLTNKSNDILFIGNATQVLHLASGKLKFLWKVATEQDWYKYTHILLHVDNKIYGAYEVDSLHLAPDTGKIELVFDYEV